jgi:hypothetical protein
MDVEMKNTHFLTKEQWVTELNRYATADIAKLFKISDAAVGTWKAGNPHGWPVQWTHMVDMLQSNCKPLA